MIMQCFLAIFIRLQWHHSSLVKTAKYAMLFERDESQFNMTLTHVFVLFQIPRD